jgi:uncharacterized 2Fe-2S/4Fe-4S cluster protein (DUF4445 family)
MPVVHFLPADITVEVLARTPVYGAAIRAGIHIEVPCCGQGTCNQCLVEVRGRLVQACQTLVNFDLEVRIPDKEGAVRD